MATIEVAFGMMYSMANWNAVSSEFFEGKCLGFELRGRMRRGIQYCIKLSVR